MIGHDATSTMIHTLDPKITDYDRYNDTPTNMLYSQQYKIPLCYDIYYIEDDINCIQTVYKLYINCIYATLIPGMFFFFFFFSTAHLPQNMQVLAQRHDLSLSSLVEATKVRRWDFSQQNWQRLDTKQKNMSILCEQFLWLVKCARKKPTWMNDSSNFVWFASITLWMFWRRWNLPPLFDCQALQQLGLREELAPLVSMATESAHFLSGHAVLGELLKEQLLASPGIVTCWNRQKS